MVEKRDVPERADEDDGENRGQCLAVFAANPKAEDCTIQEIVMYAIAMQVTRNKDTLLLVLVVMIIFKITRWS